MTKNLDQFVIGVIAGAAAYEIVKKKNPELVKEIKQNVKDLRKSIESIYREINNVVRNSGDVNQSNKQKSRRKTSQK